MSILELSFASGESSLSVRRFAVSERLSEPFQISILARSPNEDIDLDSIVGKPALFRITSGVTGALVGSRLWTGVCSAMRQVRVEPAGLSTYALTLVPSLWLLTQRRGNRLYQHLSIPDIVDRLLGEWQIEPVWRVDRGRYPKLELRVQYGETDHAFFCRLLEEAGITFLFEDDFEKGSRLVLADAPQAAEVRAGGPLPFLDAPDAAQAGEMEYLTGVEIGQEVRPGRMTIRDFDFRRPAFPLFGEAASGAGVEAFLEQYHHEPGAMLVEGGAGGDTPVADDKGVARFEQGAGHGLAGRALAGARASRRSVSFRTNAIDLAPGVTFSMRDHARADLAPG
ncbi:MAG TPA: phage late control D family protein, partial [Candidatus Nanopelagicales bacterium]|nr:phage late control D family protein [Candidatus Nanopelagicales bacterium]